MTFAPGDVVTLKSGGHSMTVVAAGDEEADCLWVGDDGELFRQSIPTIALMAIDLADVDEADVSAEDEAAEEGSEDEDEEDDDEEEDDEEEEDEENEESGEKRRTKRK